MFAGLALVMLVALGGSSWAVTPYPMSSGNYSENFSDIANWTNNFASGIGASRYNPITAGTFPAPNQTTVFTTSSTGGVQRGTGTIVLLVTGTTDNTNASAFDLYLDFTGLTAGTISLDWAEVNNSTGDRKSTFKLQTNGGSGTTFTDLPGTSVTVTNNVAGTGSLTSIALPAGFNNSAGAVVRFYLANGTGGTTGSRPKFSIDNVSVTRVCPAITLSPAAGALPAGTTGNAYSQTLTASGGASPYNFAVTSGALPAGLTLTGAGVLFGTPTALGNASFTVTATDLNGCTGSAAYALNVTCGTITVAPAGGALPTGTTGVAYSQTVTASGGTPPYTYALNFGALPAGLTLSSGGVISGTPTAQDNAFFVVRATDANGCAANKSYTLAIDCTTITVAPAAGPLPAATVGSPYTTTVTASGGTAPYTFSIPSGGLPPGLTISAGGVISGTPTSAVTQGFTVLATDTYGCTGSMSYSLQADCLPMSLTPAAGPLPNVSTGTPYSQTFTASGGNPPYTYTILSGALPGGLTLSSGGLLSGTATVTGPAGFAVRATDVYGCFVDHNYTLDVVCGTLTLGPGSLPDATIGQAYSQALTASGGAPPFTFALDSGTLPPGITLSAAGALSGTPTYRQPYGFTVKATDANGCTGTLAYSLNIQCQPVSLSPGTLPNGTVGTAYSQAMTPSFGDGPYTFTLTNGPLPPGLTLSGAGVIAGTPTTAGTYNFDITEGDANNCGVFQAFALTIDAPATNTVAPANAAACITPAHSCQVVPVNISRGDATGMRLFHVDLQLSPNLQLCGAPAASILEGTYLANANSNTTFLVVNNGGGSYTVDGTINGTPCGAVAPSGNLFNIRVTSAGPSGTGTVTVTSVTLRDCSNNTLASSAGGPASVTIDTAPVTVAAIADPQTVVQQSTLTITPSATISSCATGPATWSVSPALPGGASINPGTGVITWTPSCGQVGPFGPFTYTATAASGETATSNAFSIVVTHLAGTVTVAAITDPVPVVEQSMLTLTPSATVTPCTGTPLTWSVAPALPAGATFNTASGEIQWTPACGAAGSYGPFTLTATATTGEVGSSNAFHILVSHLAGTVTVAAIADPVPVVEQSMVTITPGATTTPCVATPLTWSVAPALPLGATFNTGTGEIQWTPACGQAGNYGPFTLTASSPSGETGSSNSFHIDVTHLVGTVTVAAIADPENVVEQSTLTITPSATETPCAGALTWTVAPALPLGASFNSGTGVISWTPACGTAGSYGPFTLTATASTGEAGASNSFHIVVSHLVGTVTVAAIADPQNVVEQSTLTILPGATETPCAGALTWTVAPALPLGASFNSGTGVISWTPACGTAGSYGPFTLTATASTGEAGASNSFHIVVSHLVGTVTVAAIADPQNVVEQSTLTLLPSATTTPCVGSPLTWAVAPALPLGATFNASTGEIQWTPTCGQAGSYGPFTLTASAPTGESGASNAFHIVVSHLVGTVTVAAIADPQSVVEQSTLTLLPSATTTPCVGSPLTWAVSPALPLGATFSASTGEIQWTPTCGSAGSYGPFTLTASAPTGESGVSNSFHIVVAHLVGTVSVAAISSPQAATEGVLLTILPSATETPCAGTLAWTVSPALPAGATLNGATGEIQWTPDCNASTGGSAGTYGPFTLTATAVTGEFGSSNAFTIHVADAPITVSAPSTVTATQVLLGNPLGADRTGITVHFSSVAGATSYRVYRAPFGHYPEYDDNGGATPTAPTSWPPAAPWTLTSVTTDGGVDTPPTRDFFYYVVYAANSCGDVSVASAMTAGTLDYHLGDVSDNVTPGHGDDLVDAADISLLGAHYGINLAPNDPYDYLDVGPTTTNFVDGRPITDNRVDFEDLVMFAINFGQVTTVARIAPPLATNATHATQATPATVDALTLTAPGAVAPGDEVTATLTAQGTGRVQAVSVKLGWNAAVVEPVGQAPGEFLLGAGGLLLSPAQGQLDAALLGAGNTLTGTGTLATVRFRVVAAGDPAIRLTSIDARDSHNQPVAMGSTVSVPTVLPVVTALAPVTPNPSQGEATLAFSLARRGPVDVSIYAANGRLVRNLFHGVKEPGNYSLVWDGRDDRGSMVAGGVFFAHMTTEHARFTQRVARVR